MRLSTIKPKTNILLLPAVDIKFKLWTQFHIFSPRAKNFRKKITIVFKLHYRLDSFAVDNFDKPILRLESVLFLVNLDVNQIASMNYQISSIVKLIDKKLLGTKKNVQYQSQDCCYFKIGSGFLLLVLLQSALFPHPED